MSKAPSKFSLSSLGVRLAVIMTLMIGLISLFILIYFPMKQEERAIAAVADKAESIARITAFSINPALVFDDPAAADAVIKGARQNSDLAYLVVTDRSNGILAAYNLETAEKSSFRTGGHSLSGDGAIYRVMTPVQNGEHQVGKLFLGVSLESVKRDIHNSKRNIGLLSLLIFLLGMTGVFIVSSVLSPPLTHMVETAQHIAGGDLTKRAAVSSRDEVGYLAASFNSMVDSLESAYKALEDANRDLERRVEERTAELQHEIEEKKRFETQLRESQKMEAIGQLAGGVAHDINNTLMGITGFCELLLMKTGPASPIRWELQSIEKAVASSAELTRKLLAFGRKQIMMPKVLDLNRMLAELDGMIRRLTGETVEIFTVLEKTLGHVKADPGQIEQVIMNLVVNARDAMLEGGKLIFQTANVYLDEGFAAHHIGVLTGHHIMLAITDNGCGMDETTRERIFEPFFTTKEVGKGTGLGLSIVYGIISQSGGFVDVESEPGRGTTFRIYLPRVDEPKEIIPSVLPAATISPGSETILFVEDNDSVRTALTLMLEMKGYKVLQAGNGEEALQVAASYEGPIHLLITDVAMPVMGGLELVRRLSPSRPETKVLYMSGYSERAPLMEHDSTVQAAYLPKPTSIGKLCEKIRELLDQSV